MDVRHFEELIEEVSNNESTSLVFKDEWLSESQALKLLRFLTKNTSIRTLEFLNQKMSPEAINAILGVFIKNKNLIKLKIQSRKLTAPFIKPLNVFISKNTSVTELDLSNCHLSDQALLQLAPAFSANTSLTRLNLTKNDIGVGDDLNGAIALFVALKRNTSLIELVLAENRMRLQLVEYLADMLISHVALTKINLSEMGFRADHIKQLAFAYKRVEERKSKSLRSIDIGKNMLGDAGARDFARLLEANPEIDSLHIAHNQLTHIGVSAIVEKLKRHGRHVSFGCANNRIEDQGAFALAELVQSTPLITLSAFACQIGLAGVAAIARALPARHSLLFLDFCGADFDEASATQFGRALSSSGSLVYADLSDCFPDDRVAAVMISELRFHPSLKKIMFSRNHVGREAAALMADYLKTTSTLEALDLVDNNMSDEVGAVLLEGLAKNSSLTSLKLNVNRLGARTMCVLAHALQQMNVGLKKIFLEENMIDNQALIAFLEGLKWTTKLCSIKLNGNLIALPAANNVPPDNSVVTVDELQRRILQALRENHSIYRFMCASTSFTPTFKAELESLLQANRKIKKSLADYQTDPALVCQRITSLIASKYRGEVAENPSSVMFSTFRDYTFLRCLQLVYVHHRISPDQLDNLLRDSFRDNHELLAFYNRIKDTFHARYGDRPLYRLGFFKPRIHPTDNLEVAAEMKASIDPSRMELALNL